MGYVREWGDEFLKGLNLEKMYPDTGDIYVCVCVCVFQDIISKYLYLYIVQDKVSVRDKDLELLNV